MTRRPRRGKRSEMGNSERKREDDPSVDRFSESRLVLDGAERPVDRLQPDHQEWAETCCARVSYHGA